MHYLDPSQCNLLFVGTVKLTGAVQDCCAGSRAEAATTSISSLWCRRTPGANTRICRLQRSAG